MGLGLDGARGFLDITWVDNILHLHSFGFSIRLARTLGVAIRYPQRIRSVLVDDFHVAGRGCSQTREMASLTLHIISGVADKTVPVLLGCYCGSFGATPRLPSGHSPI